MHEAPREELREDQAALPDCPIGRGARARWVYEQLSGQGGASQRSVKHPDLTRSGPP